MDYRTASQPSYIMPYVQANFHPAVPRSEMSIPAKSVSIQASSPIYVKSLRGLFASDWVIDVLGVTSCVRASLGSDSHAESMSGCSGPRLLISWESLCCDMGPSKCGKLSIAERIH
jgi:hypothetical protein